MFVFNGLEVQMTGRTAMKRTESKSPRVPARIDVLHEITPVDTEDGSWKKWVRKSELYKIQSGDKNNDNSSKVPRS